MDMIARRLTKLVFTASSVGSSSGVNAKDDFR